MDLDLNICYWKNHYLNIINLFDVPFSSQKLQSFEIEATLETFPTHDFSFAKSRFKVIHCACNA